MAPEILSALVFSWMVALSPPARDAARITYPEAQESAEEREARYGEISRDITRAVGGLPTSQQKGAAELLVAVAFHESGFQKDVDSEKCAPGRIKIGGCDHGRARHMWQLQAWDGEGREAAAREALRKAFGSMSSCRALPAEDRLALYAGGGTCQSRLARQRSREIWSVVKRIRAMPPRVKAEG